MYLKGDCIEVVYTKLLRHLFLRSLTCTRRLEYYLMERVAIFSEQQAKYTFVIANLTGGICCALVLMKNIYLH